MITNHYSTFIWKTAPASGHHFPHMLLTARANIGYVWTIPSHIHFFEMSGSRLSFLKTIKQCSKIYFHILRGETLVRPISDGHGTSEVRDIICHVPARFQPTQIASIAMWMLLMPLSASKCQQMWHNRLATQAPCNLSDIYIRNKLSHSQLASIIHRRIINATWTMYIGFPVQVLLYSTVVIVGSSNLEPQSSNGVLHCKCQISLALTANETRCEIFFKIF